MEITGIILRYSDYGDSSRIYTVFTREEGKISLIARGVKSMKSRLNGALQPFTLAQLSTTRGKGKLQTITNATVLNPYYDLRLELERLNTACDFAKIIAHSTEENMPHFAVHDLLLVALDLLCQGDDAELVSIYFESNILSLFGYAPILTHCVACGVTGSSFLNETWGYFRTDDGGALCSDCFSFLEPEAQYDYKRVAIAALQIIYHVTNGNYEKIKQQNISVALQNDVKNFLKAFIRQNLSERL